MFFDTHLHLIYPDRLEYPWLAGFEALNRPSTFDSYMQKARRSGISDCLHMEVDVGENLIRDETALIGELMQIPDSPMRGAISACRPEHADFPAFVEWAQDNPVIKGLRRVLHTVPDGLSKTQIFRDNLNRLANSGLTFDLHVLPRQMDIGIALVDHCPNVRFILNHCGVPDIKADAFQPWAVNLTELAKRPNVIGKISGLIAYADADTWGLKDIRPYFDHTVAAFGHDRIIWGSDSPVCNLGGGLETWVAATHAMTDGWSAQDRHAFYKQNARKIWR